MMPFKTWAKTTLKIGGDEKKSSKNYDYRSIWASNQFPTNQLVPLITWQLVSETSPHTSSVRLVHSLTKEVLHSCTSSFSHSTGPYDEISTQNSWEKDIIGGPINHCSVSVRHLQSSPLNVDPWPLFLLGSQEGHQPPSSRWQLAETFLICTRANQSHP